MNDIKKLPNWEIDFNALYKQIGCTERDRTKAKFGLIQIAQHELYEAVQQGYYDRTDLEDLNFSEICDWCGFPDLQDGGFFEDCIAIAANTILGLLDYKPAHFVK